MAFWQLNRDWGLPEVLITQLAPVKEAVYQNQIDFMSCYIGTEGLGKTTLQTLIARYLTDNKLSIKKHYTWSALDCVDKWLDLPVPTKGGEHHPVILDEAVMGLDSIAWQGGTSRLFNSVAATIRYKYTMSFLSIPRFFMLNNRVREGRLAMLCRVYGTTDEHAKIQKGYFDLYNALQVQDIYRSPETRKVVFPETKYRRLPFTSLEGTHLWNEYEEAAKTAKQKQNELMRNWAKYERERSTKLFQPKKTAKDQAADFAASEQLDAG